jgi:hypothetical protein
MHRRYAWSLDVKVWRRRRAVAVYPDLRYRKALEGDKCGRSGQYRVYRLVQHYGIEAKLFEWSDEITAEYTRKHSKNLYDQCGTRCPGLPKMV